MQGRLFCVLLGAVGIVACACCTAAAQPSPDPSATPAPSADAAAAPAEISPVPAQPEDAASAPLDSDVIVLKNGKQLVGFQVVRQTTRDVTVRLLDGVEMTIPMRQVESIQLDDISGSQTNAGKDASQPEHELIPGVKLAPIMYEKLQRSVSEQPLNFKNEDAIANVVRLSQQVEVPLEVDAALNELTPDERRWTVEIPGGTAFLAVINDHLLKQFQHLDVTYRYDRLILTTKAAPPALTPIEPPAASAP